MTEEKDQATAIYSVSVLINLQTGAPPCALDSGRPGADNFQSASARRCQCPSSRRMEVRLFVPETLVQLWQPGLSLLLLLLLVLSLVWINRETGRRLPQWKMTMVK